jgi:metallo-beta-lactamase class B
MMKRVFIATVVGLIATSVVGGQAQDESAGGREGLKWGLPSGYIPQGDWKVKIPFQIFDNVYFVGNEVVSAYLITTSDGLVLIDTTTALMVNGTLENIRKLGFDPKNIKYVFITESHEIHYGGAAQIKAATGATICLSAADWDFVEQAAARADQPEYDWTTDVAPPRDHETKDGEVIKVGDAVFTLYVTPGHTPGTSSFEYTAYDGDRRYRVLTPGGTGLSMSSEWTQPWIKGRERLKALGPWDVVLGNHPDNTPGHLFKLMSKGVDRAKGAPHPVVQGRAAIDEWMDTLLAAAREKAKAPPHGHLRRAHTPAELGMPSLARPAR